MKKLLTSLLCVVMVVCFMPAMAWAANVENCTDADCSHVAAIDNTHYDTLQEAVTAAGANATVKLIKDTTASITVDTDDTITLDLNGCTLTGAPTKGVPAITNNGTLVIKDTNGNGKITRDTSNGDHYVIDNQGTMTVESGEISIISSSEMPKGSSLIRNAGKGEAATLNITGGKLHQDGFIAVKNDDKGILNVSGGTITTLGDTDTHIASAIQNWGTANITGGEIGNIWIGTWKDQFESKMTISDDAKINGKVVVKQDDTPGTDYHGTQLPTLEINGGEFNVTWHVAEQNTTVDVAAGTFTNEVPKAYLADNAVNYEKVDGKYVVAEKTGDKPTIDPAPGHYWVQDENGNFVEQKLPYIPPTPTTQNPTIEADNATVTLSDYGTKAAIKVADGYELVDVTVNGVSKGKVDTLTGLKTGDKVVVTTKKIEAPVDPAAEAARIKAGVENTTLKIYSGASGKGDGWIQIRWVKSKGFKVDGYEVYRGKTKDNMKKYDTTKKTSYKNAKYLKKGNRYYYKVRGYRTVDGEKVYTKWSKTIYRIAK